MAHFILIHRSPLLPLALDKRGMTVPKGPPEMMAFPDNPVCLAPLAPLDLLALVEISLLKCLMAVTNPVDLLFQDHQALTVPVVSLDHPALQAPRDSQALLVSPVSPALPVPWALVDLLVPQERTEMMVRLANLVALASVALLALRVPVDSPEPLACLASRDTEVSLV